MTRSSRQILGAWGEQVATDYLEQHDYQILAHNVRTRYGEIDLVALAQETLVFVEVKTRRSLVYGLPEASITPLKQAHLLASALAYWQDHPEAGCIWRIDVIAIVQHKDGTVEITHFENALTAQG